MTVSLPRRIDDLNKSNEPVPTVNVKCPACHLAIATPKRVFARYSVFECSQCGLSFGVPDVPVAESSFNNYTWTKEWTKDFPQHVAKATDSLSRKLDVVKSHYGRTVTSMLDIGCGNGAFLAAAEKLGIYAEGTDIDLEHTQFAIEKGLKASHCEIQEYKAERSFDFIHVKESFHLVTRPKEFVEKVATMMNPQTILYLDSTHADGLAARFRKVLVSPPRYGQLYPPLHNQTYNRRSLEFILKKAGFTINKFVSFNRGNRIYCPTRNRSAKHYIVDPVLDMLFLGGFLGCYATLQKNS